MNLKDLKHTQPNPLRFSDATVVLTPTLSVMSANHVIRWIIGKNPKPGSPFPIDRLFREPELTRMRAAIHYAIETGQPGNGYEIEIFCDAGFKIICNYTLNPIYGPGQTIIGAMLSFQNLPTASDSRKTGPDKTSHRFHLPENDLLIEKLPEAVFTITTHWRISSFNLMAEKLSGYKREEAIGKYCWEIFCSDKCKLSCPLRTALDSGQSALDQEVRILNREGVRQAILVNTNVLRDNSGLVLGAVETFRPLTGEIHPLDGVDYHHSFDNIVGKSDSMQRLFSMVPDIAASDANVLICGESGTGKELFARAIHSHSLRSKGPFVAVNCSALAESLLESELFGHEKYAFTGADRAKPGRFELARGGSLFLDEIGDLKTDLQVKLLRVIEQKEFERVGGTKSIPMDARIISATNRDLNESIRKGIFRDDFYYRLRTVPLTLPPLRERKEDIPLLVSYFIRRFNKKYHKNVRSLDLKVMRFFQKYHFPGNIRELERAMEHAFVFVKGPVIFMSNLPDREEFSLSENKNRAAELSVRDPKSKDAILWAISRSGGKRQDVAHLLGISRTSLWRLMKKHGID